MCAALELYDKIVEYSKSTLQPHSARVAASLCAYLICLLVFVDLWRPAILWLFVGDFDINEVFSCSVYSECIIYI